MQKISGPLLLLALLITATACKKEDPEASLPAITQQGLNTGGFLVNGQAYSARNWSASFLRTVEALERGYSTLASRPYELDVNSVKDGQGVAITLFLRKPQLGEMAFNQDTQLPPTAFDSTVFDHAAVYLYHDGKVEVYQTSARHTGRVIFTRADEAALVSAGTFEFTAESSLDPRKTVTVSAGRFDRKQ